MGMNCVLYDVGTEVRYEIRMIFICRVSSEM
jgi:hypothetical protein